MNVGDLILRFKAVFRRAEIESELDQELRTHLDFQVQKHMSAGLAYEAARAQAIREFGSLEVTKEHCRDERRVRVVDEFVRDVRYSLRTLRKDWILALVALLTLAICIGANTTVFTIVDSVMIHPLPYPHSEKLYWLGERMGPNRAEVGIGADYYDIREKNRVLEDVAAFTPHTANLTGVENPEQLDAARVTPSFFRVFASKPLAGRIFAESEQGVNAPNVVVVSYRFWKARLNGDFHAIGKTISLDGSAATVVGVMPEGFDYPRGTQLWRPLLMDERNERPRRIDRPMHIVRMVARLKPHISDEQLNADLSRLTAYNYNEFPKAFKTGGFLNGMATIAVPLQREMVGDLRHPC